LPKHIQDNLMKLKLLLLVLPLTLLSGCANWALKNRCENTNWFEYSQKVAFDGRYLEEDGFVKDCKKVDRTNSVQLDLGFKLGREKMCQYDEIYARAKDGVPVFFKFCDGLNPVRMKSLYTDGLVLYCTAEKGYSFAKSGRVYLNLCNPEQEKKFLPAYYKGRREYLNSMIESSEKILAEVRSRETGLAVREARLSQEYSSLPEASECSTRTVYNESTKQDEYKLICQESSYIRMQRDGIYNNLTDLRKALRDARIEILTQNSALSEFKTELTKLPQ